MDIFAILVKQVLHWRKPTPLASPHPSNRVWSNLIITDELWRSRTLPEKLMTEGFGLCASNRRLRPPRTSTKTNVARGKTLISLMDFSVSPSLSSPLSLLSWPISKTFGPAHLTAKIRSASNFLQISESSMARFFNMNGRGLHFCLDSTSKQWFCGDFLTLIQSPHDAMPIWKISKEHYTLKIPLPSTLHLRLSRFDWNSNLSHSSQFQCSYMKPFVRRLHLDNKLPLLLVWLRFFIDNLLLESSRTLAFEASILNELGIMIQSIRNCGYRCVFMLPSSTRLIHKPVKLHLINFLKFPLKNLKTSGIMIPIQCSGGYHNIFPQGQRLGYDLNSHGQSDYKLCVEFLNLHGQRLHVREDPPALLRLVTHQMRFPVSPSSKATSTWQPSNPLVSSMEHTFKSSDASIVRANYDHVLVRDFLKLVFKLESYKTSKDLPSLASSSRLCIFLEDSCSLYLYICCNPLLLSCKNIPLLRF